MKTQRQSRKFSFQAKEKTAGHRLRTRSSLLTIQPCCQPFFQPCEHRDKSWIHGPFKSPWRSSLIFSQLLTVHSAHFLKAYSPGLGKWGFCCSSRLRVGKPAQGGWAGGSRAERESPAASHCQAHEVRGKDIKGSPWLTPGPFPW